ncbi:MAG: Com family DNA-binding transcriptional regulator [Desulfobacterales bacterium]|nr:Com family DNA-binding transcriptional regulator [Desulfobacterales bacterium]
MDKHHRKSGMNKKGNGLSDLNRIIEYRCPVCNRLLMKGKIITVETKCPKCKKISILRNTAI